MTLNCCNVMCNAMIIPYSGETFEGENLHGLIAKRSDHFAEKTFAECYKPIMGGYICMACPSFVEKIFADGSKATKFVNVFSLESTFSTIWCYRDIVEPTPS